jgi:hypothetical protein
MEDASGSCEDRGHLFRQASIYPIRPALMKANKSDRLGAEVIACRLPNLNVTNVVPSRGIYGILTPVSRSGVPANRPWEGRIKWFAGVKVAWNA